jgi:hypothetical protein
MSGPLVSTSSIDDAAAPVSLLQLLHQLLLFNSELLHQHGSYRCGIFSISFNSGYASAYSFAATSAPAAANTSTPPSTLKWKIFQFQFREATIMLYCSNSPTLLL